MFVFNVDGGERSKVSLCIFPNHLIPFFMSSKNTNHYLLKKPQTYTFDYAKIIYIIFKNCDGKHYFRVYSKRSLNIGNMQYLVEKNARA